MKGLQEQPGQDTLSRNQEQPELDEILAGPVAYVFYETEPVEAAKTL